MKCTDEQQKVLFIFGFILLLSFLVAMSGYVESKKDELYEAPTTDSNILTGCNDD